MKTPHIVDISGADCGDVGAESHGLSGIGRVERSGEYWRVLITQNGDGHNGCRLYCRVRAVEGHDSELK